jgi:SAM-dependent methyltransferase
VLLVQGYDVVVCESCGFAFADNIPEQEAFDAYYQNLSKYEYQHRGGKESDPDRVRLMDVAEFISRFIHAADLRILDVGCATGRLLALLREKGFANVWGLDPSLGCAEAARKLFDIPVFTDAVSGLAKAHEKFDFIIMSGVLEHIRDLEGALATLRGLLTSEGRIYLDVPDATQFADWPDAPFQEFSIEHINFFSGQSLANLMQVNHFSHVFSQKVQRNYTETTVIPSVEGIFEKDSPEAPKKWDRDGSTAERIIEYIRQSERTDAGIRRILERTSMDGRSIVVWGVGTHTQRLLAAGALDGLNISRFVDSNPNYHGKRLQGIPIVAPEELKSRGEPILICSRVFQLEILRQIRDQLELKNEVLLLYELQSTP